MNGPHLAFFGNLTRDPDKRFSQNDGNEYVRISVAVNTVMGEERRETEYIAVNLYENHMRSAMARATKGTPVYISGRMSHREYQRQDGSRGCELHVHARDFRILHRAPEGYQPAVQTQNELPQGQDQPMEQAMDQAVNDHMEQEEDLDFNDPLPMGPDTGTDPRLDQPAQDPTAEQTFEGAVETAAFPD